jgi:hypothetical protein
MCDFFYDFVFAFGIEFEFSSNEVCYVRSLILYIRGIYIYIYICNCQNHYPFFAFIYFPSIIKTPTQSILLLQLLPRPIAREQVCLCFFKRMEKNDNNDRSCDIRRNLNWVRNSCITDIKL